MNASLSPIDKAIPVKPDKVARRDECERYVFLLLDGFMMMALASAIEALRLANHVSGRKVYDWALWSIDGMPVQSSAGLPAQVEAAAGRVVRGERLVVVGGSYRDLQQGFSKPVLAYLRRAHKHGVRMVGLCTGALALSEAGALSSEECAVHWEYLQPLAEVGNSNSQPKVFALGEVPTAAGGVAVAELFLHLISDRLGVAVAVGVADSLLLTSVRQPGETQVASALAHAGTRIPSLRVAISAMEAASEEVMPIEEIAAVAGISVRQLERNFKRHLSTTPYAFYTEMRLQRARRLLTMTDLAVAEVALATGFTTSSQLSRRYRRRFGTSPHRHSMLPAATGDGDPRESNLKDRGNRQSQTFQHGETPC